jgi:glutamyl-tRNA synthetase
LYARRHGGTFILRIEDTDVARSSDDMVSGILSSLTWLGLTWDEGPGVGGPHSPYFQTERLDKYRAAADRLVASGHAYFCYCTPDDLKAKRDAAEAAGSAWSYDRTCKALSAEDIAAREAAGTPRAVRFFVPPGTTSFTDLVRGRIEFAREHIDDFVIIRSDGFPTYHLSVVVDDVEMEITQVVRGDDHISNTPKQVLLYEALGAPVPEFAHVPLILGPDKKRLSKRHGATAVGEYETQGYLPEAMINFLALLGWSPGGNQELYSREELIARFTLDGISGGNAVFNTEKLDWFNQQHIIRLSNDDVLHRLQTDLRLAGLWRDTLLNTEFDWVSRVLDLLKPRARKLADLIEPLRPFLLDDVVYDEAAVAKHLSSG